MALETLFGVLHLGSRESCLNNFTVLDLAPQETTPTTLLVDLSLSPALKNTPCPPFALVKFHTMQEKIAIVQTFRDFYLKYTSFILNCVSSLLDVFSSQMMRAKMLWACGAKKVSHVPVPCSTQPFLAVLFQSHSVCDSRFSCCSLQNECSSQTIISLRFQASRLSHVTNRSGFLVGIINKIKSEKAAAQSPA